MAQLRSCVKVNNAKNFESLIHDCSEFQNYFELVFLQIPGTIKLPMLESEFESHRLG